MKWQIKKNNWLLAGLTLIGCYLLHPLIYLFTLNFAVNDVIRNIITYIITIGIITYIFFPYLKKDLKDLHQIKKKDIIVIIIFYLVMFFLMHLTNNLISKFTGGIAANERLIRENLKDNKLWLIIILFLAPIYEEFTYRLTFKDVTKHSIIPYILTSLIFASVHVLSATSLKELLFIIPYFFMGLAFGFGLYKTRNIFTSILLHSMHNTLSLMLLYIL